MYSQMPNDTKVCRKCGATRKTTEFRKGENTCRNCDKERKKKYRAQNKDKIKEYSKEYYTQNKDKIKEYSKEYYTHNRDKLKEYYTQNKDKIKEREKKYRTQNRDKRNIRDHNRQARIKANGGKFTARQWQLLLKLYDHKCAYCGKPGKLTIDHIIPISRGGLNVIENIVPACQTCNFSKSASELRTWIFGNLASP
jgi:5-methylcytosine-specific restriction endonuclease McrA